MQLISKSVGAAMMIALATAVPAQAGQLSAKERARLENQSRVEAEISRDWADAAKGYDRGYKVTKALDRAVGFAVRPIPGGSIVYKGSKAATEAAMRANERRKSK